MNKNHPEAAMVDVPPAVVVGAQVNGLGVVRSLTAGRVPVIAIDTALSRPAMWSRSSRRMVVRQLSGRSFVDSLLELQTRLGSRPVLILTDETAVTTVSEYRDELSAAYRFHLPTRDLVTTLDNKARFHEFAERHDLPVPTTVVLKNVGDLAKLSRLRYPLIAKPADKQSVHTGLTRRLDFINTREEALTSCTEMLNTAGELIVQEWIAGPDSNIYFSLFHRGKNPNAVHIFHGRKIASYPPRVGSTAVCLAAPEMADVLGPLTEKFLEVSDYEGLGSLEFKWDSQLSRFVIIEPTVGRTDWQEEIATLSGLNLPLIAYRHELGLPALSEVQSERSAAWRESFRHRQASTESLFGCSHLRWLLAQRRPDSGGRLLCEFRDPECIPANHAPTRSSEVAATTKLKGTSLAAAVERGRLSPRKETNTSCQRLKTSSWGQGHTACR